MQQENFPLPDPQNVRIDSLSPDRPDIWSQTISNIQQMQTGELSDDVAAEVKRRAAESASLRGQGIGRMGGALTLRDLGIRSDTQRTQGIALGLEAGQVEGDWNMQETELEQQRQVSQIAAQQQQQQINQAWLLSRETVRLQGSELAVSSAQALTASRQARVTAEIGLIELNARLGTDVQAYLDAIGGASGLGYFEEAENVFGGVMTQYK